MKRQDLYGKTVIDYKYEKGMNSRHALNWNKPFSSKTHDPFPIQTNKVNSIILNYIYDINILCVILSRNNSIFHIFFFAQFSFSCLKVMPQILDFGKMILISKVTASRLYIQLLICMPQLNLLEEVWYTFVKITNRCTTLLLILFQLINMF